MSNFGPPLQTHSFTSSAVLHHTARASLPTQPVLEISQHRCTTKQLEYSNATASPLGVDSDTEGGRPRDIWTMLPRDARFDIFKGAVCLDIRCTVSTKLQLACYKNVESHISTPRTRALPSKATRKIIAIWRRISYRRHLQIMATIAPKSCKHSKPS
jgi:hypothetical protein